MASARKPGQENRQPAAPSPDQKPIRLSDLIPDGNVKGGRRTVFGTGTNPLPRRKPPK